MATNRNFWKGTREKCDGRLVSGVVSLANPTQWLHSSYWRSEYSAEGRVDGSGDIVR